MSELSPEQIEHAFRVATNGYSESEGRWADRARTGLTDDALEAALRYELGTFGGRGGPDELSITFQGSGLKIWAGESVVNHVQEKPVLQGRKTMQMARAVYGIGDPSDPQLSFL